MPAIALLTCPSVPPARPLDRPACRTAHVDQVLAGDHAGRDSHRRLAGGAKRGAACRQRLRRRGAAAFGSRSAPRGRRVRAANVGGRLTVQCAPGTRIDRARDATRRTMPGSSGSGPPAPAGAAPRWPGLACPSVAPAGAAAGRAAGVLDDRAPCFHILATRKLPHQTQPPPQIRCRRQRPFGELRQLSSLASSCSIHASSFIRCTSGNERQRPSACSTRSATPSSPTTSRAARSAVISAVARPGHERRIDGAFQQLGRIEELACTPSPRIGAVHGAAAGHVAASPSSRAHGRRGTWPSSRAMTKRRLLSLERW